MWYVHSYPPARRAISAILVGAESPCSGLSGCFARNRTCIAAGVLTRAPRAARLVRLLSGCAGQPAGLTVSSLPRSQPVFCWLLYPDCIG